MISTRLKFFLLLVVSIECIQKVSVRFPRTGDPQLPHSTTIQNVMNYKLRNNLNNRTMHTTTINPQLVRSSTNRNKEQYLFDVFEAIISTLETKLQRIDKLDNTVEYLVRRVELLDLIVNNNIDKTDFVIANLNKIDNKLFNTPIQFQKSSNKDTLVNATNFDSKTDIFNNQLMVFDEKLNAVDYKITILQNQLEKSCLPTDEVNMQASEKEAVSMNMIEITKDLNAQVLKHVTKEFNQLRTATINVDRKLQFHITLVSENLGKVLRMMTDVHETIVDNIDRSVIAELRNYTTSMHDANICESKTLLEQIKPIINVSEKINEVWDVVVGTKSSVDDLLPKSNELLTQTQRQERAIGEMHSDFRTKANKIIQNLDMVEKRLQKQDVSILTQRPVPSDGFRYSKNTLIKYNSKQYNTNDYYDDTNIPVEEIAPFPVDNIEDSYTNNTSINGSKQDLNVSDNILENKKGGVIFPDVKNKPLSVNASSTTDTTIKDIKEYSCVDLLAMGTKTSGVYYLQIRGTTYWFLKVYCEQNIAEGGWTVIQRRDDFGEPRENFNRDWNDYKNGFGDPAKEFWLGNENIYMLTNNEEYMLRIELEDFEGNKRYAQYSHFKIYSESEYYKLEIDGYSGNAGDALNDPWYGSNKSPFSTYNRDNDRSSLNCASMLKGGWWWKSCGRGLNGLYLSDPQDLIARQGIVWFRWKGWDYTLQKSYMMIKPKNAINAR